MSDPVLRPATLDDAALAADLMTAAYPRFAQDPIITRYRWERTRRGWTARRYIAEVDARPIAFVDWLFGPPEQDRERHCEIGVALNASELNVDLLTYLWRRASDGAEADGSLMLEAYAAEDEPEMLEALARAGFERDRAGKVWELDLEEHGPRLRREAAEARSKMAEQGINLSTVADWPDPDAMTKIFALDGPTRSDIPTTFPILPETLEEPMAPTEDTIVGGSLWPVTVPRRCLTCGSRRCAAACGRVIPAATESTAAEASLARSSCSPSPRRPSTECSWSTPTMTRRMPRCSTSTGSSGTDRAPDGSAC